MESARICMRTALICGLGVLLPGAQGFAQSFDLGPRPVARAHNLTIEPVIDGNVLDDPAWRGAEPITGFKQIQPNAGQPASQRTEVFVGFTATALHIAVIAYDDEPLEIITTDTRRDSSLNDTDAFRVIIDGLLDRQNGYVFGTNSAGMEFDGQVSREGAGQFIPGGSDGLNLNWDAPWTVKAAVSDVGWSAEMEIPFTSLRYGSGDEQVWGFNFERRIRRNKKVVICQTRNRMKRLPEVLDHAKSYIRPDT